MQKYVVALGLLLLIISGCSSSSSATAVPLTTPLPPCKDGVCVQQVIVSLADAGDLFILFMLTDQVGQVNAAQPPQFTQSTLSVQAYQLAPDQSEKPLFEQELGSEGFVCWVTNTAAWSRGKLSAVCGLPVSGQPSVQIGDRLKIKLNEFGFEQVVEITAAANNSAANRPASAADRIGGTRIVLAPPDCSNWTASGKLAEQLYLAGEIILYRLRSALRGLWIDIAQPAVFIDECAITVELSPLGDPTPYIQLMQQPGQFELIDVGAEYHTPGKVLRTTNHPSPTVPISTALQSALPLRPYDVIATNADLKLDQLVLVGGGGNSMGLQFGFQESAAQKLAKVTTAHSVSMNSDEPYYLCILLDDVVEFCPSISMPHINGGVAFVFNNSFTAQRLASILRNGQLPLELKIIKVETIYSQTTN
jgi:hypothetical protein